MIVYIPSGTTNKKDNDLKANIFGCSLFFGQHLDNRAGKGIRKPNFFG